MIESMLRTMNNASPIPSPIPSLDFADGERSDGDAAGVLLVAGAVMKAVVEREEVVGREEVVDAVLDVVTVVVDEATVLVEPFATELELLALGSLMVNSTESTPSSGRPL